MSTTTADPTLVIYHGRCPDGFAAAWIYWQALGERARYLPACYGTEVPETQVDGQDVVIVDFSFPRPRMEQIHARARSLRLLDHHASAHEELAGFPGAHFDLSLSGAGLAWQDRHGSAPLPALLRHIQDRDLHRPLDADAQAVLAVVDALAYEFSQWQALADRLDQDPAQVLAEGRAMRRQFEGLLARFATDARPVDDGPARGLAANVPREFAAELGHRLAAGADFGFTWSMDDLGRIHASWRSAHMDVIPMARRFGGGGHTAAAGARMTLPQLQDYLGLPASPRSG